MNISADNITARSQLLPVEKYLIILAMIIYPVLLLSKDNSVIDSSLWIVSSFIYFMGIYLYFGMCFLLHHKRNLIFYGISVLSLIIALTVSSSENIFMTITPIGMIIGASILSTRLSQKKIGQKEIYTIAIIFLASIFLIQIFAYLPGLGDSNSEVITLLLKQAETDLTATGYSKEQIDSYLFFFSKVLELALRLLPAMLVLGVLLQFSIGYIYFIYRVKKMSGLPINGISFPNWKMPFYIAPLLLIAMLGRIIGNPSVQMLTDNLLFILSVYYSITGFSLISFFLKKFRFSIWSKSAVYIILFLSQIIGYFFAVILGFIDSFLDFRKIDVSPVVK